MNRDELEGKTEALKGQLKQATGDFDEQSVGEAVEDVGNALKKWSFHMEIAMRTGHVSRIVGALALVLVFVGVASAADIPDAWVTMKTKVSLMTTEGLSTMDLNVDTVKGVVTLHGKVATAAEKAKSETVARGIDGAKEVKNLLQVVPNAQREVVERSDDLIKKGIDDAFKANRRVSPSGITVASVNKGVVLLSGKTKSLEAHLEAVEVANAVRGVRRVATEVEVMPPS